jgi:DNA-binding NarL/FixJ family response regulator
VRGPRAEYARALASAVGQAAGAHRTAPIPSIALAVQTAATATERDGWRFEGARMRMVAAAALAQDERARAEAADLAAAALLAFRAMETDAWRRRAEGLLRRLGRRAPTRGLGPGREGLTARELEVLGLVADGHSNRSIAAQLVISEATVARHVANLFAKLAVHSRAQAARLAAERGLLEPGP